MRLVDMCCVMCGVAVLGAGVCVQRGRWCLPRAVPLREGDLSVERFAGACSQLKAL